MKWFLDPYMFPEKVIVFGALILFALNRFIHFL